nr:putative RNA polymerase sigma factor [uncultured bacterium]
MLEHCGSLVEALAPRRVAAVPRTGQPRGRSRRRESYDHLEPLLAELSQLSPDDARRDALRSELITTFLPVARNIARKYLYRGEHLDDLEQVATLGLINAIDRFDPDRGTDFLAFAVPTISGEVQRHYRDRTARIRIPRPLRDLHVRIQQAVQELSQRHGAAPKPRAVAAHLDVDVETVIEALQAVYETHCSSLDEPVVDDESGSGDASLLQRLGAEDPEINLVEDRQSLTGLLNDLPERERRILLLRFYGNMTQTEIAKRIGISQMHVSRLLAASLAQLRRRLCTDG